VTGAGIYGLTIAAIDGTSAWVGRVIRIVLHVVPTSLRLATG
jgi:hypothetical protein